VKLASWGADLLDLLLPAGCVACRDWIPGGHRAPLVCAPCASRLRVAPWPRCARCHHPRGTGRAEASTCRECAAWPEELTAARYAYELRSPADDLVHALKYEGWPELAAFMGDALARLVPPEHGGGGGGTAGGASSAGRGRRTVVVPVPTTAERVRSRGYNQAELLARRVSEVRGLPFADALLRGDARSSQTTLAPDERRRNVSGAFAPAAGPGALVRGARVLLVDDVLTTGATASEAASVLAEMGAEAITLLAFGRALATAPGNGDQALS